MKKFKIDKKDIFAVITAEICCVLIMYFSVKKNEIYGSSLDWASQHYAIPEYFRTLFYQTGDIFPSLGANIGAGENLFCLSYYGLFSPIILFSYLLPWVDMASYIITVSIIGILATVILFYWWIRSKFSIGISFVSLLIFCFSTSFIFHSHRHIMFVSYFPFLILALHFTDVYFSKKSRIGLIISCILIIFTNYFFAVSSLLVVSIYAVYCWIKKDENVNFKGFFKIGLKFVFCLFTAILIAGVLLSPTVTTIFSGRDSVNISLDIKRFIPFFNFDYLTFNHYSLGLTSFIVLSIIDNLLHGNRENKFLSIVFSAITIFPVFIFILNGGMYFDPKVLIPFLPIALILCAETISRLRSKTFKFKWNVIIYTIVSLGFISVSIIKAILGYSENSVYIFYSIDFVLTLFIILLNFKRKKNLLLIAYTVSCAFVSCFSANIYDKHQNLDEFKIDNSKNVKELIDSIKNSKTLVRVSCHVDNVNTVNKVYSPNHYQTSIYSSIHNKKYNRFYFEDIFNENSYRNSALTTSSRNLLFNIYMGNKYIISDENFIPSEYKALRTDGDYTLYENNECLPLGYSTSDIMSTKQYKSLSYPYNTEAILKYTIVDNAKPVDFHSQIKEFEIGNIFEDCKQLKNENGRFISNSTEKYTYTYTLPENLSDKLLFLRFKVDNSYAVNKNDARIQINGVMNVLTSPEWKYYNNNQSFEYVISDCTDKLEIDFFDGQYAVYDIDAYTMDKSELKKFKENKNPFIADLNTTKGDEISGKILAENDGYFNLSMIYHDGYKVYVDGVKTESETVDTAFLGFKLSKGEHDIKIVYTAEGLDIGKIISAIGILTLILAIILDIRDFKVHGKQKK